MFSKVEEEQLGVLYLTVLTLEVQRSNNRLKIFAKTKWQRFTEYMIAISITFQKGPAVTEAFTLFCFSRA